MPFTFPSVTVSAVAVSVVLFVNLTVVPSASGAVTLPRAVPLYGIGCNIKLRGNSIRQFLRNESIRAVRL